MVYGPRWMYYRYNLAQETGWPKLWLKEREVLRKFAQSKKLYLLLMLSSVAAFCATADTDIDVSHANELARNVSFKAWTDQFNPKEDLPQSVVLIVPTDPSKKSLKITITNPKFTQRKYHEPLFFSIERTGEQEILRAKVTCPPRPESNLPALCSIFLYKQPSDQSATVEHMVKNYRPFHADLYACTPQNNVGQTLINVDECTLQSATIATILPNDTDGRAHRALMTVSLDKDNFLTFNFTIQRMDHGLRQFVDISCLSCLPLSWP